MALLEYLCHPFARIWVLATGQLYVLFPLTEQFIDNSKREARQTHSNFIQDYFTMSYHGTSYQTFMTKIIDHLITLQDKDCDPPYTHLSNTCDLSINTPDIQTMECSVFIWGFTSLSTLYRSYHDG